jgi:hypothetical protein
MFFRVLAFAVSRHYTEPVFGNGLGEHATGFVEMSIPGAHLQVEADYVVGSKTRQSENLGQKSSKTARLTNEFKVSYCLKSKRDQQNLTDFNGFEGG